MDLKLVLCIKERTEAERVGEEHPADTGPERKRVKRGWRRLHSEELRNLYSSPSIMRMRCANHVARMGRREMFTEFGWDT